MTEQASAFAELRAELAEIRSCSVALRERSGLSMLEIPHITRDGEQSLVVPELGAYSLGSLGSGRVLEGSRPDRVVVWYRGPSGVVFPEHCHPYDEALYLERGRFVDHVSGEETRSGEVAIIPAHQWHRIEFLEPCRFTITWTKERKDVG